LKWSISKYPETAFESLGYCLSVAIIWLAMGISLRHDIKRL
jgi:hypothetical protein